MRPSLFPNLLSSCSKNYKRGEESGSFFEVGPIFIDQQPEDQINQICGLRYGKTGFKDWTNSDRDYDWLDAKADAEAVIRLCGLDPTKTQLKTFDTNIYHPGRSGIFSLGKTIIATFGEIHPLILKKFNLSVNVVGFEVNIENVPFPKKVTSVKKLLKLDNLQEVKRDFSFIIDKTVSSGEITRCISSIDKDIIKEVRVFDLYEGEKIEADKKSLGVTVFLQPKLNTFSEEDLEGYSKRIIENVSSKLGGYLRD